MYLDRFVNGTGQYIDDLKFPNMLYMSVVRSPYAHARIKTVSGGLNALEIKGFYNMKNDDNAEPIFAIDEVRYVGQPVAAVFSENRYESEDLIEGVAVDYEPINDAVTTIEASLKSKPIFGLKNNILSTTETGKTFDESEVKYDIKVKDTIDIGRVLANPMETRGIIADYRNGVLHIYVSSQSIHRLKNYFVKSLSQFGISEKNIVVHHVDTGGAFGLKAAMYPEYIAACYASMKYKKPVKWIETRTEHINSAHGGRGIRADITVYAKNDGEITGLDGDVYIDNGAYYVDTASDDLGNVIHLMTGPYKIEKAHLYGHYVLTNKSLNGWYRGAGKPEAGIVMERMIDLLADKLNMDMAEIRLKNAIDAPFKSPLGLEFKTPAKSLLEDALKYFDYEKKAKEKNVGIALFMLDQDAAPGETCRLIVKGGIIHVYFGGDVHGQGHELFARSILNKELGVEEDKVILELPDTEILKEGVGTWGSRSAIIHGSALIKAAELLRKDAIKKFGKYDKDILLNNEFDELYYYKVDYNEYTPNFNMVTSDPHDPDSIKIYSYYDIGKKLNEKNIMGQIEGGAIQAISEVLCETIRYSEDGQVLTTNITDSGLLTADKIPEFHTKLVENPSGFTDMAKGVAESPSTGIPIALARSIEVQLKTRINKFPIDRLELFNRVL